MKMPLALERMMFGFIESQVLFVCNELKIFDYLIDNEKSSLEEISDDLKLPKSSLERLLISAQCMQLLKKDGIQYEVIHELVPYLSRKSRFYCGDKFSHYFKTSYGLFNHLLSAVNENKPQWNKIVSDKLLTCDINSIYTDFIYSDKQSTEDFLSTMWASGYTDSIDLCTKFSFAGYKRLVDLGGATGSFSIAAMQNNPQLSAVIMDYPSVRPYANEKLIEYGLQSRGLFLAGDIFSDALPAGDIYVIGYLLSDLPEAMSVSLIKKIYHILPKNGLIVILEKLFADDKSGPYLTAMLNLTMLLEMQGQHRSTAEYIDWLQTAGFQEIRVIYSAGEKHMLAGIKNE